MHKFEQTPQGNIKFDLTHSSEPAKQGLESHKDDYDGTEDLYKKKQTACSTDQS